jgi:CheY-like chemotaxis protein/DNA-binding XRE family transcriptional regulator
LGQRLKYFRLRVGWTLAYLASRVGVSHQQIHKYEQGLSKISPSMLYKFSVIFSTSPGSFFDGCELEQSSSTINEQSDILSFKAREKINLLLIEGSASDEFLVRKVLENFPYKFDIYCLHNATDSIHYLRGRMMGVPFLKPDIVLLDLNFDKEEGLSVLKAIKQDRQHQYVPVLVLTSSLSKQDMINAYKNFANGYIVKSFDFNTLKKHLQTALGYWIDTVVLPES